MSNATSLTALSYLEAGLCVLPAKRKEKHPILKWSKYEETLPTVSEVTTWFSREKSICVVAGRVSGNVEALDFDLGGEMYERWKALVQAESPGLFERLVIESTPSGGKHASYRSTSAVPGNRKLAERVVVVPSAEPIKFYGKEYKPRKNGDRWEVRLTLIETRGEGGIFLCSPTQGYVLQQGSFTDLPILNDAEHAILIEAACALNEALPVPEVHQSFPPGCGRPGDEFNERGDVPGVLRRHGWHCARGGENEYWRRPGKNEGWSATLKDRVFYVFSSNAAPFEPDRAYSPFAVYTLLEHNGDFSAAATSLRAQGFTGSDPIVHVPQETVSNPAAKDPGPIPAELFRIPGFVSEVMDHCLETAPYPNVPLAFCGALALQAVLGGRKVRDAADNRTNVYLLALAYSAVGKDWPRKLNTRILQQIGQINAVGEKFASGEGIQDSLIATPAMIFQTDEIDGLLNCINKSQDARYESLLGTLLTIYSSANTIYPLRRKAGKEPAGSIDQPCLVLFGTAIPTHYYQALSERLLTNGFFARTMIIESGRRSEGQEPQFINPPPRVMDTAHWWAGLLPGQGNLQNLHPEPITVDADGAAVELLKDARRSFDAEYSGAESRDDAVGMTVWGRVSEHIRKLALLYAISANHRSPSINAEAVTWATDFVQHHTRRMLFMAQTHVAENPFHALCLKLIKKLQAAPGRRLAHSVLLKRMKIDARSFNDLVNTMVVQGDLVTISEATQGRTQTSYELPAEVG